MKKYLNRFIGLLIITLSVNFAQAENDNLIKIIADGNATKALSLIQNQSDLNIKNDRKNTPLIAVMQRSDLIEEERIQIVSLLLKKGANPNLANDNDGETPLHDAVKHRKIDIMRLLLASGANPNIKNKLGETPLFNISFHNNKGTWREKVILLMEYGADINSTNLKGERADVITNIQNKNWLRSGFFNSIAGYALNYSYGRSVLIDLQNITFYFKVGFNPTEDMEEWKLMDSMAFTYPLLQLLIKYDLKPSQIPNCLHKSVYAGDLNAVKLLLTKDLNVNVLDIKEPPSNSNLFKSTYEQTPLFYTVKSKSSQSTRIAEYLLKMGANINHKDNIDRTPFLLSCENVMSDENLSLSLLKNGADYNISRKYSQKTLLTSVIDSGKINVLKALVEKGIDINEEDKRGKTLLHYAVKKGQVDIVKYLIDKGLNINKKYKDGNSPLHEAVKNYNYLPKLIVLLLENGVDIDTKNNIFETPLHIAAKNNHLQNVNLLLEKGANIDAKTNSGNTPLILALQNRNMEVAKLLIYKNANIKAKNNKGNSAEMLAKKKGVDMQTFFSVGRFDDTTEKSQLFHQKNVNKMALFLARGANVNSRNEKEMDETPLFYADVMVNQNQKRLNMIELLIANGADLNHKNKNGFTAIHKYLKFGNWKAVKLLVENGAHGNILDEKNKSLLELALIDYNPQDYIINKLVKEIKNINTCCSPIEIFLASQQKDLYLNIYFKILFNNGLNPDQTTDKYGKTLLHFVTGEYFLSEHLENNELLTLAIQYKANPNIKDTLVGWTPLYYAVVNNNIEAVNILLSAGATGDVKDNAGFTPLDYAKNLKLKKMISLLESVTKVQKNIESENNTSIEDSTPIENKYMQTKLHQAVASGNLDEVIILLKKPIDVNTVDKLGRTPLHYAAFSGYVSIARILLEKDADINVADRAKQWTPLFFAVYMNQKEMIKLLLEKGADETLKDKLGRTVDEYRKEK